MKDSFFILAVTAACLLFASCGDDIYQIDKKDVNSIDNHLRNYQSALKIAENAVFGNNSQTRSLRPGVKNHYLYSPHTITRSANDNSVASFYVINFEDEKGFAIVSADDRATPVYAFSDKGNLDAEKAVEESGWGDFFDAACNYYKAELRDTSKLNFNFNDDPSKFGDVAFAITQEIDGVLCKVTKSGPDTLQANAFLSTTWNQCSPYNYYYPKFKWNAWGYENRAAAGCVPVALGQIMAYNRYPTKINGKNYDWDAILSKSYYYIGENTNSSLSTAHLLYDIACTGNAQIDSLTSMTLNGAKKVLDTYGYKYSVSPFSKKEIWSSLEKRLPVYVRGSEGIEGNGHAWVIDGGRMIEYATNYHEPTAPYKIFRREVSDTYYFHCNWGWGYYYQSSAYCLNVFDAPNGSSFSNNPQILYHIQPK